MKKITLEWIHKAENDWLVAEREMQGDPPVLEAVCFHAQQCAEKFLKAVLEENGLAASRTHDLLQLLDSCSSFVPELFKLEEEASLLSSCAVEVRYPGVEPDQEEAKLCLAAAASIRALLKVYLGLPSTQE